MEGASTTVTILVGETERGPVGPTRIGSAAQYARLFGGYSRLDATSVQVNLFMPYAVRGFFDNGGESAYVLRLVSGMPTAATASRPLTADSSDSSAPTAMLMASGPGVWAEGVRIAVTDATDGDPNRFNLFVFYQAPGAIAHSEVERFEGLSPDPGDKNYIVNQLAGSAFVRWNGELFRPASVGDPAATPPGAALDGTAGTGGDAMVGAADYDAALATLDDVEDAALIVCASDGMLNAVTEAEHNGLINAVLAYVESRPLQDLFLVADAPRSTAAGDPVANAVGAARAGIEASDHLALYWPHIVVNDPVGLGRNPTRPIPAAGHVAGIYGRTDRKRGVWKTPAGVDATVVGAVGLDFNIIDRDQERMNPHGPNALREIPGAGRVVWAARTRQPDTEWRYINVRRTAMFLTKSIHNGIQWAVFEPNDEKLWAKLRRTIDMFLETLFRGGALVGETSCEAYFVKCGAETTTPSDQALGIVNVLVGFAPLRPTEFVILTISQKTAIREITQVDVQPECPPDQSI